MVAQELMACFASHAVISYGEWMAFCRDQWKKSDAFILKPEAGAQGRGISLTKTPKVRH